MGAPVRRCSCGTVLSRFNQGALCGACLLKLEGSQRFPLLERMQQLPPVEVVLPPLGPLLRSWRREHVASQAETAALLGVDQSYVSLIERGRRQVRDVGMLAVICARLGFAPQQLGLDAAVLRLRENDQMAGVA